MSDPLTLARALREHASQETRGALVEAIRVGERYRLPSGRTARSQPGAISAWIDAAAPPKPARGGARPGAGRKPGQAREGVRRTLLLSHAALAVLEAVPERQRGAWVSAAIEAAAREPER